MITSINLAVLDRGQGFFFAELANYLLFDFLPLHSLQTVFKILRLLNELLNLIFRPHDLCCDLVQLFLRLLFDLFKSFSESKCERHIFTGDILVLCLKLFLRLAQLFQVIFKYFILLVELLLQLGSLGLVTARDAPQTSDHRLKMSLQALHDGFVVIDFLRSLTTFLGFTYGRSKHLDLLVHFQVLREDVHPECTPVGHSAPIHSVNIPVFAFFQ